MFGRKGILFVGLFATVFLSNCSFFLNKYYTDPDVYFKRATEHEPYDALIVTGYPYNKDSMSFVVKNRVDWATYLYHKGLVKNLIFSGAAVYTPYVEAEIMAMYARQLGVPEDRIFIEPKAEHSVENLYYCHKIAEQQGFKTIALSSDPSQASFLKSINDKRFKIKVDFIPIVYDTLMSLERATPSILQDEAYVEDFVSIIEREGVLKRLWGTRGRKVKKMLKADKKALKGIK